MSDVEKKVSKDDMSLEKLLGFSGLDVRKEYHAAFEQGKERLFPMVYDSALVGLEIEVENIRRDVCFENLYWEEKEDNSLRNYGREFTSIPLRTKQVEFAMNYLREVICRQNTPDFSPRTSVHVHLNVRDMSWNQIRTFLCLYAMFERHFFLLAGGTREKSIFCVPLYKSKQSFDIPQIEKRCTAWHKYNAINCGTICGNGNGSSMFGTIEFRHLYGTLNTKEVVDWVNNILCLRKAAVTIPYPEIRKILETINTTSAYLALYRTIFGEYARPSQMAKLDFETCITRLKLALWTPELKKKYKLKGESLLYTYYSSVKPKKIDPYYPKEWATLPVFTPNVDHVQLDFN